MNLKCNWQKANLKGEGMSRAAFSLRVFSIYMFCLGAALVLIPNILGGLFGIPETKEVWIHVVGVLVLILGYLDFMAAGNELVAFFRWSVPARLSVPVFFLVFVLLKMAPPILILFGVIDGLAAIWTALALRADSKA